MSAPKLTAAQRDVLDFDHYCKAQGVDCKDERALDRAWDRFEEARGRTPPPRQIIKLSDARVREILQGATQECWNPTLCPSTDELAALAQAVLDLRTANSLLTSVLEMHDVTVGLPR